MYKKLLQKIDRHIEKVRRRHPGAFVCRAGCADCCVGGISVWRIEHENMREYVKRSSAGFRPSAKKGKCQFLSDEDLCSIYPARPIVCRLWGAPVLEDSLRCCDKNFTEDGSLKKLKSEDIINLELVLSTLAAINHVYCKGLGFDPAERFKLGR